MRGKAVVCVLLVVVVLAGLGACARSNRSYRTAGGVSCAYHGWRAAHNLRRHHPGWTAWHLYWAARSCRRALGRA